MPDTPAAASAPNAPDLTSVRTLITSVTKLAKHLEITSGSVYQWIKVNRIPGAHVIKVANFYDVEVRDLLPLTGSDKTHGHRVNKKPRTILPALLEVYRGSKTLDEACAETGVSLRSATLVMVNWGDELPTLYTTLEQLDQGRISLDQAAQRLKISKITLHGLRSKYGYAPGAKQPGEKAQALQKRREARDVLENKMREQAFRAISGDVTAVEAAKAAGVAYRTMFRTIEAVSPRKLNELSAWPKAFRKAYACELSGNAPSLVESWLKFAADHRLLLKNMPRNPSAPKSWAGVTVKRMLVGVLLGEVSVEDIAAAREVPASTVRSAFTSDLMTLNLTFDVVMNLPYEHQIALAELLMAVVDRKRKFVPRIEDVLVSGESKEEV